MGRVEHQFTTDTVRASGYLPRLKLAMGVICLVVAALDWMLLHHPLGPHSETARLIMALYAASAVPVGIGWIVGRWPSYRITIAFVVWADLGLAVTGLTMSSPEARLSLIGTTTLVGIFTAFLLGTTVLIVHCGAAALVVIGVTAHAAAAHDVGWFDLLPFYAPVLLAVAVLPVIIQAIIEGTRRSMTATTRQAFQDPMTGLNNRRGMDDSVTRLIHRHPSSTLLVAVIDVDNFKELNDRWGHEYGDGALRQISETLRSTIRSGDIAVRLGGDEFAVIAAVDSPNNVAGLVERIQSAMATLSCVTVSIGIAHQPVYPGGATIVEDLLRHADRAMYAAKNRGGNQVTRRRLKRRRRTGRCKQQRPAPGGAGHRRLSVGTTAFPGSRGPAWRSPKGSSRPARRPPPGPPS